MRQKKNIKARLVEQVGDGTYKTRNPEIERKVLKQLFSRPDQIGIISATLRDDHFADPRYRDIYLKSVDLHKGGRFTRSDPSIVLAECLRRPSDEIDPSDYKDAVEEIIREERDIDLEQAFVTLNGLMLARRLQAFSHEVISKASAGEDVNELITEASSYIRGMSIDAKLDDDMMDIDRLIALQKNGANSIIEPERNGILSPWPLLNAITFGFRPGDITVIGGRPGTGKSAMLAQIAFHSAFMENYSIFYAHEMTSEAMWGRLMCCHCNVTNTDVSMLELSQTEKDRCRTWLNENAARKYLRMSDKGGRTPMQVRSDIIRHNDRYGPVKLVGIDYLQRMYSGKGGNLKRNEEVAEISKALKDVCTELNVTMVIAASMNREYEKRQGKDKRPELSDLYESGQIESDASVVLFPYRPSMTQTSSNAAQADDEIIVRKNRHGAQGIIPVRYAGPYYRFESIPGRV